MIRNGSSNRSRLDGDEDETTKLVSVPSSNGNHASGPSVAGKGKRASGASYERPLNAWQAGYTVFAVCFGTGSLALPAVLHRSGWLGLIFLIAEAVLAWYTAVLLGKSQFRSGTFGKAIDYRTYGDIAFAAYGKWGKRATDVLANITLVAVAAISVVLAGGFVQTLSESVTGTAISLQTGIWIMTPFFWLHVWIRDLKFLARVSVITLYLTLYMEGAVFVQLIFFTEYRCSNDPTCFYRVFHFDVSFFDAIVNFALVFAVGAHAFLPTLNTRMEKCHDRFPHVIAWTFAVMAVAYAPFTIVGYYVFGSNTLSPILDNLEDGFAKFSAIGVMTVYVLISYPLLLKPPSHHLEEYFRIPPDFAAASVLKRAGARSLLVALTVLLALLVPSFRLITNLVSSVTYSLSMLIIPCVFYMTLHWLRMRRVEKPLCVAVIVFGVLYMIFGTYSAVRDLIAGEEL